MILDKRLRALIVAGFFCFGAALGGGARAAEVYPGCAQPGPTAKVWYVDPVNGKTPADGGNGRCQAREAEPHGERACLPEHRARPLDVARGHEHRAVGGEDPRAFGPRARCARDKPPRIIPWPLAPPGARHDAL